MVPLYVLCAKGNLYRFYLYFIALPHAIKIHAYQFVHRLPFGLSVCRSFEFEPF